MPSDLDRFLALVRRELGAADAVVLEPDGAAPDDPCEIRCSMSDGRRVAARFAAPPEDADVKRRRLEILAATFDAVVETAPRRPRSHHLVARSLRDELEALRQRASAVNALVIDANSPVVWGAARPQGVTVLRPRGGSEREPSVRSGDEGEADPAAAAASRRALNLVRSRPEIAALRKGKHLRHVERGGDAPLVAHSFAGIYLLVLVFAAPFDELRAERAILEALPRIERLVLALPPLDPAPRAGVVALRRPRRK